MEAEGPITRNLCTDVKQLEQSQGSDSVVPMSHGSYSQSKAQQSLFSVQGPSQPLYQCHISADRPVLVSPVQERVCSRSKRTTPPSIIRLWGEQCRFYPKQKGTFSIKQGQIGSVEAQRCLLSTGEDCKGRLGLIKARGNYTVLHSPLPVRAHI